MKNKLSIIRTFLIFTVLTGASRIYSLEAALAGYQKALTALQSAFVMPPKITTTPTTKQKTGPFFYETVEQWIDACKNLPSWRTSPKDTPTAKDFTAQELINAINACEKTMSSALLDKKVWVNAESLNQTYIQNPNRTFKPYTQKLILPPDTKLLMHGDLHGDMLSVRYFLKELLQQGIIDSYFKIIKPDHYIIFLGDYTDRGLYGAEVLYSILRLKAANPTQCVLVRGNHEDADINARYGFMIEIHKKFGAQAEKLFESICNWYHLLPVVLFVGSQENPNEFIQCCHGGIEVGYNPSTLFALNTPLTGFELIKKLDQKKGWDAMTAVLSTNPDQKNMLLKAYERVKGHAPEEQFIDSQLLSPHMIGFMWSDFIVDPALPLLYDDGRGWMFGALSTLSWRLSIHKNYSVVGIFRAHQHSDDSIMKLMMDRSLTPGAVQLWRGNTQPAVGTERTWNGMVITLNVCPDTPYGRGVYRFYYDTYARLTIGSVFEKDWKLEILSDATRPKGRGFMPRIF